MLVGLGLSTWVAKNLWDFCLGLGVFLPSSLQMGTLPTVMSDGHPLCSRHRGHTRRGRRRLTRQRRDAKMALHPQTEKPHGHHRDESEPQAEATAQDTGRRPSLGRVGPDVCPIRGLGSQAARRPRRGVGTTSPSRVPRSGALMPATRSRTRFIHCRGQPPRTHVSSKRPKRSRIRRCHTRVPGECRMALGLVPHTLKSGLPGTASHREGTMPSQSTSQALRN